jgi:hypothetical protein
MLVILLLTILISISCETRPSSTTADALRKTGTTTGESGIITPVPAPSTTHVTTDISPTAVHSTATPEVSPTVPSTKSLSTPTESLSPQAQLRQLTDGQCCTNPFWSSDGRTIQFIDRPPGQPLGIYGVSVTRPGPPRRVSERVLELSSNGEFFLYPEGNRTVVHHIETNQVYFIENGGRQVLVSPDGNRLLWQETGRTGNFDERRSEHWVSDVNGENVRQIGATVGYSWSEWIDSERVLLVGAPLDDLPFVSLQAMTLGQRSESDGLVELARVTRPRETLVSPGGAWVVFVLTFQSDPDQDGIWLVPTDGSQAPLKLPFFGGFHWRDDGHLLFVPLEADAAHHTLWEYDVVSQDERPLTDPQHTPYRIANNDWTVSPDGRYIVFLSAEDHNLWLLDLLP